MKLDLSTRNEKLRLLEVNILISYTKTPATLSMILPKDFCDTSRDLTLRLLRYFP
jgi:hypothetical protein